MSALDPGKAELKIKQKKSNLLRVKAELAGTEAGAPDFPSYYKSKSRQFPKGQQ